MELRCPHCGAAYDAPVSAEALGVVDRCARCGRTGLEAAWHEGSDALRGEAMTERPADDA
jgi:predicted Zn finger-like uncharacterized protein